MAGAVLVGLLVAAALLSFVWNPTAATEIDIAAKLQGASALHWLGTDSLGRYIVSRSGSSTFPSSPASRVARR